MRDAPRLHVDGEIGGGGRVVLDDGRRHYLLHVMRLAAGDAVRLFNARNGEWIARVGEGAGKREATLVVGERLRPPPDGAGGGPALLFAPLKRDATDLAVRMATELGARSIGTVLTERTVASRVNGDRLGLIAREAAEQCERLDVPAIAPPLPLLALLDLWRGGTIAVAVERNRVSSRPLGRPSGIAGTADALLVGPEGGFSDAELDALGRHRSIEPVSLGPLVLRAETAVAAGLALLRAEREQASGAAR